MCSGEGEVASLEVPNHSGGRGEVMSGFKRHLQSCYVFWQRRERGSIDPAQETETKTCLGAYPGVPFDLFWLMHIPRSLLTSLTGKESKNGEKKVEKNSDSEK